MQPEQQPDNPAVPQSEPMVTPNTNTNSASVSTPSVQQSSLPMQQVQSMGDGKIPKKNILTRFGKVPLIIIAVVILLSASAAAYFGIIVPNNPTVLWKTAMNNTARGMDKYLTYSQEQNTAKGSKFSGNFNVETTGIIADGTFEGQTYETDANIRADFGAAGSRVNLELLMNTPENAKNPDIYVRVKGLEGLGAVLGDADPSTSKLLKSINNQWYVLDHTLLDQMYSEGSKSGISELTPEDIIKIQQTIIDVTNDYIFTTEPDKAVMTVRESVGKEELDGREVQHYKVGINKENLKQYVATLKDELNKTKLGELFKDSSLEESLGLDEITKSIDELDDNSSFDVWVDRETKLVRRVKLTDKDNQSNHLELSLNYDGGTSFPLVLHLASDEEGSKSDATLTLVQDTSKKDVTIELAFNMTTSGDTSKGSFKMTTTPSDEEVEFTKPVDAKSIYELLGTFLGGSSLDLSADSTSGLGNFDL